jgi:uncharacterized repeat protein (TIGR01451 family)
MNLKRLFLFVCAIVCAGASIFSLFDFTAGAQVRRKSVVKQAFGDVTAMAVTLADSFPDPDGDGRAADGAVVTYTAVVTNNGASDANNVSFTHTLDANSTLIPNSLQIQTDQTTFLIRCSFNTAGATGGCGGGVSSATNGLTDANLNTIIGGQGQFIQVDAANLAYDAGTEIFQFDATVQNLIVNALGTLDGTTPDADGVRLFLYNSRVTSGTGSVSVANADGTDFFTAGNQPYFRYNEILETNEVSASKPVQFNVPSTVGSFTADFLVSTKAQVKVVINEVLSNPGGTITDASGEWFELYNAGQLPVDLQGFRINDYASSNVEGCNVFPCTRPYHLIASSLTIAAGGYAALGNTTNTTNNGGVPVDYAYGTALSLVNSQDGVRLSTPEAFGDLTIDQTIYRSAAISAQNGVSRELKNSALENSDMDGSNWDNALVTAVYGPGGRGTPKAQNSGFTPFAETVKQPAPASAAAETGGTNAGETVLANLGTITTGGYATVTYKVILPDPIPAGVSQVSGQGTVTGDLIGTMSSDDPSTPAVGDATVTPVALAPTAASVTVGGRVSDEFGRGVLGAQVALLDADGTTRTVRTNSFGYYGFADVEAGSTVTVSVRHKRYAFAAQVVSVGDNIWDLNFTAVGSLFFRSSRK